ncbi:MAG: hypothetical protein GY679_03035 [Mycoplasma sp.]|nr:hypothetical protein [Mycoplasma sp.]
MKKKSILKLGSILPLAIFTSIAVSCTSIKGRKINIKLNKLDKYYNSIDISPFIQNAKKGTPLDIPFLPESFFQHYEDGVKIEEKEPFTGKEKIFKKSYNNLKNRDQLDSALLQLNTEINSYLNEEKKKNPDSQFIAIYNKNFGTGMTVQLKELKNRKSKFLSKLKPSYDFTKGTQSAKHNGETVYFNGSALRLIWPVISHNENDFAAEDNWLGLLANRIEDEKQLNKWWETANKPNVVSYPFIDFKEKVLKVMVMSFDEGNFKSVGNPPYEKIEIVNAKKMSYKVITINNFLPFKKTANPSQQQQDNLMKLIKIVRNWITDILNGPSILQVAGSLMVPTIPQIQLMLDNALFFADKLSLEGKKYNEKWLEIPMISDDTLKKYNSQFIKSFQESGFDFSKFKEILELLDPKKPTKDQITYKKMGLSWLSTGMSGSEGSKEQNKLIKILLILNEASKVWNDIWDKQNPKK